LHLTRVEDPDSDWITPMVATARERYGPEWCLFGDPDEFGFSRMAMRALT
jgi:hypothetical protein